MVKYAILGPIELTDGERLLRVGGPRQVALLAFLLLNANRALSSDRLIDALWGPESSAGALKRLHVMISRLRKTLDGAGADAEPPLRTVGGGYLLTVKAGELDAEVFETRVQDGRHALDGGDARRAREVLGQALEMWRGPALAEVAHEEFAQAEIRRLQEQRMAAIEARVDAGLHLGEHRAVLAELESLVTTHPGRERLAAQLMLALYRCGRQGDALDVYARARAYLSSELGLEPGPSLQRLQAAILAQAPELLPDEPGSAEPAAQQTVMLPTGVVSFLLTDVEGSTRLWEADADAMATALELHDDLIARVVEDHGGRLLKDKGEGDATLSVFGGASDAVACAAELQRVMATTSWPAGIELRVRIALHCGEAQERDGDYFGPVLNRAARLRSLAAGGVTVVSQTIAELVRDRLPRELALVDLGRHELRGLSRAEHVFELRATPGVSAGGCAVVAEPVSLELPRSLQTQANSPFVGRDIELARLHERWRQARGGARSAVVIGGEPGIGKTRLASEFAGAVHEQGALVLYGRCDEGLAVPYQPFVEALRPYTRAIGPDRLRTDLGHLAPELGRLLPELAGLGNPTRGDTESARFALFEAIAALIDAMTRQQPALLVLDDLHWAPPPTLLLLRQLLRCDCPLRGLVLCTYRETELDPGQPLAQLLADLHCDASAERLSIRGLGEAAIATLVQAAVGHALDDRTSELARVLGSQTAGNPFYIRELLAHVAEAGGISPESNRLTAKVTAAQLHAPEGLRHVIGQRVARLSAGGRRVLCAAAVAGPTFSFVLLERVLGEPSHVLDALDEAVAAGLLTEAGPGDYVFAHALVRQTIYQQLGSARRMRLHRQLGEALEMLDPEAHVEALAHHFAQAAADGQGAKAIDYALAAGRSATARLGYEEAAAHYERGLQALTLTRQPQEQRRCELLLGLGEARWGIGELDAARQAYRQAAELADKLGDAPALARAALGFCGPHRGEVTAAVTQPVADLLQQALTALDESDSPLRAQLMGRLGTVRAYTGVEQANLVLVRQALQMARRLGDKATLADVLASSLWATRGPDCLHESMALARELARVTDEVGEPRLRALAHVRLLDRLLELGDIDAAERELEAMRRLAETRHERYFKWVLAVVRASHSLLADRLEDFEALAHEAFAHRYEGNDEAALQIFGAQILLVRIVQGCHDEPLQTVERLAAKYPQIVDWRCVRAFLYARLELRAQARHELELLARAGFEDLPRDASWLSNLSTLTEVAAFLGDAPRAQLLYKLLLPYADRCVLAGAGLCQGSASDPLGVLATTLGRYEDAEGHFERALEMNAQIRSPLWIAHTQHHYARMLLLRGCPGDSDKALGLLVEALTTADELGLRALADKTRPLKLAAEAAVPSSVLPGSM